MKYPIWKPILILVVLVGAGAVLWAKGLKPGIDLAGGTTLTYNVKIGDTANAQQAIDDTIAILKNRVDPTGTRNLIWRQVAGNRLEVQMAQAGEEVTQRRNTYLQKLDDLRAGNINERDLGAALQMEPGQDRQQRLERIASGNDDLLRQLKSLARQRDQLEKTLQPYEQAQQALRELDQQLAQATGDAEQSLKDQKQQLLSELTRLARATNAARSDFAAAKAKALSVNISPDQWQRIAQLSDQSPRGVNEPAPRAAALDALRADHPGRVDDINALAQAWSDYESVKGPLDDYTDLVQLLKGSGVLEFRIAARPGQGGRPIDTASYYQRLQEKGPGAGSSQPWRWFEVDDVTNFFETQEERDALSENPRAMFAQRMRLVGDKYGGKYYVLLAATPDLAMTRDQGWELGSISRSRDQLGRPAVGFDLDARGSSLMTALTKPNVGQNMAVMIDNKVVTAPNINETLPGRGIIEGDYSPKEFEYLIRTLKAGSLQGQLEGPISVKQTGPQLGQDNLRDGVEAAIIALVIVAVFMAGYYFFAGMVANFALAANMVLILGAMAAVEATFTLPGIAGVVLTIGMAVDANVLIFERIREELQRKADLATAVRLGYEKAFSTILDANITTLITCFVLGYTATAEVKGFAVTLGVGIVATLFTALFCTRIIMEFYVRVLKAKDLHMLPTVWEPLRRFLSPNIDWVGMRRIFVPISLVLIVLGIIMVFERGSDMLDIEFRSGTQVAFEIKDGKTLPISEVRDRLEHTAELAADAQDGTLPADAGAADREQYQQIAEYLKGRSEPVNFQQLGDATVVTAGKSQGGQANAFSVSTLITDTDLVSDLVKTAFADVLTTSRPVSFQGEDADRFGQAPVYPVTQAQLGEVVNRVAVNDDVSDAFGGVAIVLQDMTPALSVPQIQQRIQRMRLQPAYEKLGFRESRIVPFQYAGSDDQGNQLVKSAVVVTHNSDTNYLDNPDAFDQPDGLAVTEWHLVHDAMQRDTSLASVSNFSSQVSATMQQQAIAAMALSLLAVVAYIWIRFGSIRYGFAAIIALVHDVCITLGLVAICGWLYQNEIAHFLLVTSFKINLALVAALLTIVGYSLNDTIVVFDRIRENRGRLSRATPAIINDSINQTISRTILTSGTTLLATIVLYIFGGPGVHGFAFSMTLGVFVGTYSSIAIAAPILLIGPGMGGGEPTPKTPAKAEPAKPVKTEPAQPVTTG